MARVALVTGGTRGIGEATSVALKDAGYSVAASYGANDEAARAFTEKTGINAYKFDVGDFDACAAAIKQIESEVGPIDVLVNNAGITRDRPLHKMSQAQAKREMAAAGLEWLRTEDFLPQQHFLVFRRP